jgi:hypothetical protein
MTKYVSNSLIQKSIILGKVLDLMGDICLFTITIVEKKNSSLVKTEKVEDKTDSKLASNILRIVPANNAFYFFTDIGQHTNRCSTCLADFCNAIQMIDVKSVDFHFKRGDFALWISETLGDSELANEINKVSKTIQGEELRTAIHQTVDARLTKLKKLQASEEPYLERSE